jgi:hypothetical protein
LLNAAFPAGAAGAGECHRDCVFLSCHLPAPSLSLLSHPLTKVYHTL